MIRDIVFLSVPALVEAVLPTVIAEFEGTQNVRVQLKMVAWENYRAEIVNMALRQEAVDVALVGTPVTSDLIGMNVLRPFLPSELTSLGGAAAFLPSRWQAGIRPGETGVWAIPYVVDIRLLYYWRDMLQEAGIDEQTAFQSLEHIAKTLQRLRENGLNSPWDMYDYHFEILHSASSWIWASGGDLFSPDGKEVVFNRLQALEGVREYFKLLRYVPSERTGVPVELFTQRRTAVAIANAWAFMQDNPADMGCAPLPGGSYVGGSDLVVWNTTHHESAALQFVRFLNQPDVQSRLIFQTNDMQPVSQGFQTTNTLPSRMELLNKAAESQGPIRKATLQAALTGRMYPCVPMVGLVEERLSAELSLIQKELISNPQADLDGIIRSRFDMLARRINAGLGSIPGR